MTLHGEGHTERDIDAKLRCSKTAVNNAITKFNADGTFHDRKRSGRPRKTAPREDRTMRLIVLRSPKSSCKKILCASLRFKGTAISSSTVSRRLSKEFGLKSHKPARKPRLTPVMKKKRLDFARRHRHWTLAEWKKVLFPDESIMQQFVPRHRHIRRPAGKRFDEKHIVATMKHPPHQMIWGAMSCRGAAGLYFIPPNTTMNRPWYVELLKEKLKLHIHDCTIFMQDGVPCHRSKVVTEFLKKNIAFPQNKFDSLNMLLHSLEIRLPLCMIGTLVTCTK